jgi:hypothetical protein
MKPANEWHPRKIPSSLSNNAVNILIVGAAGNLGSLLTKHLLTIPHHRRLLTHKRVLPFDLACQ